MINEQRLAVIKKYVWGHKGRIISKRYNISDELKEPNTQNTSFWAPYAENGIIPPRQGFNY